MGADTHGEPFYENPPKQQNTIASFEDAKEAIAKAHQYPNWLSLSIRFWHDYYEVQSFINKAAELYAESKASDAWGRACEAQKQICADRAKTTRRLEDGGKVIDKESILKAPKPEYK